MKSYIIIATLLSVLSGVLFAATASAGTKPGVLPCKRGNVYVCQ
jgi:hypothetical protein